MCLKHLKALQTHLLNHVYKPYLKPVKIDEELFAKARVSAVLEGKKRTVSVIVSNATNDIVFEGDFVCFVLENHVLQK